MLELVILAAAAFSAGVLNTLAGGGTFLTFPALVLTGLPPVQANATSAVAVFPGYLGGAYGFRAELRTVERRRFWRLTVLALAGGLCGALLLLVSSNAAFSAIVPFLLLFATIAFLFGPQLRAWAARHAGEVRAEGALPTLAVSLYGGYFNGGLGIVILALFSTWGWRDLHLMNGMKSWLSFGLTAISVVTFAVAGLVAWPQAAVMMVFAIAGGYAGAPLARAVPQHVLRWIVALIGFGMSVVFFARLWTG